MNSTIEAREDRGPTQDVTIRTGAEPLELLVKNAGLSWFKDDDITRLGLNQLAMLNAKDWASQQVHGPHSAASTIRLVEWNHVGLREAASAIRADGWLLANIRQVLTLLVAVENGQVQFDNPDTDVLHVQGTELVFDDVVDLDDNRPQPGFDTRFIPVIYWQQKRIRWSPAGGFNKYRSSRFLIWRQ